MRCRVLRRYRKERGGKIQWIICPTAPIEPGLVKYRQQVEELIKDGCEAIYLWGVHADPLVAQGKMDLVAEAVELPKQFGVPSGVGCHALEVVQACERHGVKADFYIKTFHSHSYPTAPKPEQIKGPLSEFPGYWCSNPQETVDFMKGVAEALDCVQDDGGGRDSAAAGVPPRVFQRCRFRAGRHVRLRDRRRCANRQGCGGCPSRPPAALAGLRTACSTPQPRLDSSIHGGRGTGPCFRTTRRLSATSTGRKMDQSPLLNSKGKTRLKEERKGCTLVETHDGETTLQDVKNTIARFSAERDWQQFHSAKNVSTALVTEAAELLAHFRWSEHGQDAAVLGDVQSLREIRHEVADVLLLLAEFANVTGIDMAQAVAEKMEINAALSRGEVAGNVAEV